MYFYRINFPRLYKVSDEVLNFLVELVDLSFEQEKRIKLRQLNYDLNNIGVSITYQSLVNILTFIKKDKYDFISMETFNLSIDENLYIQNFIIEKIKNSKNKVPKIILEDYQLKMD